MYGSIDANRRARAFAGQTAGASRKLGDQTVSFQDGNVRFFQKLFEEGVREARRQTEVNIALTQELFEQAEDQREALRRLTENVMRAYWSFVVSPLGSAGEKAEDETAAPAPEATVFPIPGYSRLTSAQVIEKLDGLSAAELKKVRAYEMEHKNRKALLAQIEGRIRADR